MPSPYVRRRRLAAEFRRLRRLREECNMTCEDLARRLYVSRTKITRLENAQVRAAIGVRGSKALPQSPSWS